MTIDTLLVFCLQENETHFLELCRYSPYFILGRVSSNVCYGSSVLYFIGMFIYFPSPYSLNFPLTLLSRSRKITGEYFVNNKQINRQREFSVYNFSFPTTNYTNYISN